MSTIKCTHCNNVVDLTENFCPHCGKVIDHSTAKPSIKKENSCPQCGHDNQAESQFCEKCGVSLKIDKPKTLHSKGHYSGTMIKGKPSKLGLFFKVSIIVFIIAFIAWYNLDPDAEEMLGDILFSVGFMLVFGFFIWLKRPKGSRKKRKKERQEQDEKKLHEDMEQSMDESSEPENDYDDGDGSNDD
jgi:predicted RNA-binding Zn-ribbon protein involved in translation (DUF1610 family)